MREKNTHVLLLGFDICFSTHLRLGLPSICCCFQACVVRLNIHLGRGGGGGWGRGVKVHIL